MLSLQGTNTEGTCQSEKLERPYANNRIVDELEPLSRLFTVCIDCVVDFERVKHQEQGMLLESDVRLKNTLHERIAFFSENVGESRKMLIASFDATRQQQFVLPTSFDADPATVLRWRGLMHL
ncbi:unnamed protein product [Onchocerca ochengi]|uniref:DHC_N1 domain-containing protein n=1 Tax=Onchocerca ochengi TaxID=42157 RepID=A0A182EPN4_ONCOC|nr:unnamed protein product [Onchocerca ochengi]